MKTRIRIDSKLIKAYRRKQADAQRRGHEMALPLWYFGLLKNQKVCFYTGQVHRDLTLERIDNNKGYVIGNVIPVSHRTNTKKGCYSQQELKALLEKSKELLENYHNLTEKVSDSSHQYHALTCKMQDFFNDITDNAPTNPTKWHTLKRQLSKRVEQHRALIARRGNINKINNDIELYDLLYRASTYYSELNEFGILLNLLYQQPFNPREKFGY